MSAGLAKSYMDRRCNALPTCLRASGDEPRSYDPDSNSKSHFLVLPICILLLEVMYICPTIIFWVAATLRNDLDNECIQESNTGPQLLILQVSM